MTVPPAEQSIAIVKRAMSYLDLPRDQREPNYQDVYFDSLTDDVEFSLAVPSDMYIWGQPRHGREAVRALFNDTPWDELMEAHGFQSPPEFFASGDGSRVVMLATEGWKIVKTGVEIHSREFAQVMDIRDGKISRILIIQDQSDWNDAYPRS